MKKKAPQRLFALWNAQNANRFCLNIDWLQAHVSCNSRFQEFETPLLKIERSGQSKVFRNIYTVKVKKENRVICTYATDANEEIMPLGHGVIKVDNFWLYRYSGRLKDFFAWLLRRLDMTFIGLTRLDIAYDFNLFCNKRHPECFIKAFLKNDIVKLKGTKFRVAGEHDQINVYNWIAFGAKTSMVNYKLYNKSLEMRQATMKAHIQQEWESSTLDKTKDVWRIEFTINSNTNLLLNKYGNASFHSLDTLQLHIYAGLFRYLFEEYFDFRQHDRHQCRKDRMKRIDLLLFPEEFGLTRWSKTNPFKKDHDRSTKIFIRRMNNFQDEMRGKDDDFCGDTRSIISKLISIYSLQNWAEKKGISYDQIRYAEDLFEIVEPVQSTPDIFKRHGFNRPPQP